VTDCERRGVPFGPDALEPDRLAAFMGMLSFDLFNGRYDIHIDGLGLDHLVSEVANTTLKEPKVGQHIPLVAQYTQGEVINFAAAATARMSADGHNILMEGRAQTLDYVRTPHRFELTLKDPNVIGQRRAAQRMVANVVQQYRVLSLPPESITVADIVGRLEDALAQMAPKPAGAAP